MGGLVIQKRRNRSRSGAETAEGKKYGRYGTWVVGGHGLIHQGTTIAVGGRALGIVLL